MARKAKASRQAAEPTLKRYTFVCEFSAVAESAEEAWEHILEGELQESCAPEPDAVDEVCPKCDSSDDVFDCNANDRDCDRQEGKPLSWHCGDCGHSWPKIEEKST